MTLTPTKEQVLEQYRTDVKQHGPLHPNWRVKENGGYVNTQKEHSNLYPLCPQARASKVKLESEKPVGSYRLLGAVNTPSHFCYDPNNWIWTPGNSSEVMYKALVYSKATNTKGDVVSRQDVEAEIQAAQRETNLDNFLYHPMNRKEPTFGGEAVAAEVACAFQRSLWVLCPRLPDTVNWNAPWDPEIGCRPYIHLRFGPGEQGDYPPIVVGLLPMLNNKPDAHWFFVQPCQQWKTVWEQLYVNVQFEVMNIANKLGFPKGHASCVQYALVACHRTMLLAPGSIDLSKLPSWISQYIEHLISTHSRGVQQRTPAPFKYNKMKPFKGSNGLKITPVELDSWIIAAKRGSPMYVFAERWNKLLAAKILYTRSSTLANWKALLDAQRMVGRLTTDS